MFLGYRIDLHLLKHKLAIEIDENRKKKKTENNTKELKDKKQQKKILIVHLLGLILIKRFLHNHIKKSPKKSLTGKTSKRI